MTNNTIPNETVRRPRRGLRTVLVGGIIGAVTLGGLGASTANAHVTIQGDREMEADARGQIMLRVPHGCGGEATDTLTVRIPDGIRDVRPEQVSGWTASVEIGDVEPYDSHGNLITEGVVAITWTADDTPLPDDQYRDFGITLRAPSEPGVYEFPAVQYCGALEEAWIDEPGTDYPAPRLTVIEASNGDDHGHSHDEGNDDSDDHGDIANGNGDDHGDGSASDVDEHIAELERTITELRDDLADIENNTAGTSAGVGAGLAAGALGGLIVSGLVIGLRRRNN